MSPEGFEQGTKQVSIGFNYLCAVNKNSELYCWKYTKLGMKLFSIPIIFNEIMQVKSIGCGYTYVCAVTLNKNEFMCANINPALIKSKDEV